MQPITFLRIITDQKKMYKMVAYQDSASVDVVVDSVTPSTVSAESIGAKLNIKA